MSAPLRRGGPAYMAVMDGAGWQCQCRGECGRAHRARNSDGRCVTGPRSSRSGGTAVLSAVPTDPEGQSFGALCGPCWGRIARARRDAAEAAELAALREAQCVLFEVEPATPAQRREGDR